jgi:hypothetical protein
MHIWITAGHHRSPSRITGLSGMVQTALQESSLPETTAAIAAPTLCRQDLGFVYLVALLFNLSIHFPK